MQLNRTFILLSIILFTYAIGLAQDPDATSPPPAARVPPLSGDFALVKKITYLPSGIPLSQEKQAAQDALFPPSSKIKELDAVKKGAVRHDMQFFVDGSSCEIWRLQDYRLSVYSAHPNAVIPNVVDTSNNPMAPNQYHDGADFPELDWITPATSQGIQVRDGKKCYAHKKDDQMAWIEAASGRPVYFESKAMQVTYNFSAPPDEALQLPKGYAEKIDQFRHALRGQF